jgi:hypothetical protein
VRHILRFGGNKYCPMAKEKPIKGHIAEPFCWCRPILVMPVRDGIPVYLHAERKCEQSATKADSVNETSEDAPDLLDRIVGGS